MYLVFIFSVVAIIGIATIYLFIVIPSRVRHYKEIAIKLNAKYTPTSQSNAEISGVFNGKEYTIKTLLIGGYGGTIGKAAYRWTEISIIYDNQATPLIIKKRFFKNFPDWKEIFTKGDRKERVFGAHINLKNVPIPIEEKYKQQVVQIFQELKCKYNQDIRKGDVSIDAAAVSYKTFGIITDLQKIKTILNFLEDITKSI